MYERFCQLFKKLYKQIKKNVFIRRYVHTYVSKYIVDTYEDTHLHIFLCLMCGYKFRKDSSKKIKFKIYNSHYLFNSIWMRPLVLTLTSGSKYFLTLEHHATTLKIPNTKRTIRQQWFSINFTFCCWFFYKILHFKSNYKVYFKKY